MTSHAQSPSPSSDEPADEPAGPSGGVHRRSVLLGATLGGLSLPLLAACGSGDDAASADGSADGSAGGSSSSDASSGAAGSGGASIAASEVPVGGGAVLAAAKVVVTQPTKGTYHAFSAICTHQGCPVNAVQGGEIVCPCHASHFSITDGSPTSGPAPSALAPREVTREGGNLIVT